MSDGSTLTRYDYYKGPRPLGDLWALTRGAAGLTCSLATHSLGWELRLKSGANLIRSQVCKSETEVFRTSEAWETEAKSKGWA